MHASADQPDDSDAVSTERAERVRMTVYQFLVRRNKGENLDVASYAAEFPDLMPELKDALEAGVHHLRHVFDANRAAGDHEICNVRRPIVTGYRFVKIISAGAQGTVYEAIQESTRKTVAIKVVQGFTRHSVTRFEREAHVLAGLSDPGIVS